MAYQSVWYFTDIPAEIVDLISKDIEQKYDEQMEDSVVAKKQIKKEIRNSKNAWIPSSHWLGGFLWHYVERANRENFLYDLTNIDEEQIQYTQYEEGQFYTWHNDAGIGELYKPKTVANDGEQSIIDFANTNTQKIRKLSFVLQLSDASDYEGGNLQLLDESGQCYFAPRKRGTIILFDSRTQHRVLKVTKGLRKSIVGWVVGPRWK